MHPRPDIHTLFAGVVIELAMIIAITVLAALHVLNAEATTGLLATLAGARAMMLRGQSGGQGGAGGARSSAPPPALPPGQAPPAARVRLAEVSAVAAFALLFLGWLLPHHLRGEA